MNTPKSLFESAKTLEKKIGWNFSNQAYLLTAFVHRSYVNEDQTVKEHNERMEFLGDSVLGLIVSEYLYLNLPDIPEGELSFLRSRLVEASSCVKFLEKFDIEKHLLLGKGEIMNLGRGRESIRADLFEAILGAIYLDGGYLAAKDFFLSNFREDINKIIQTPIRNWKAVLQDWCQKKYQTTPVYKVVSEEGPDHRKVFKISVMINGEEKGFGQGNSKKEAQQAAAEQAFSNLPEDL